MRALLPGEIAATNVRPAFEASLRYGASEEELERVTGLTRVGLSDDDAIVTGDATYRHMELMFGKPGYAEFVVAAARSHMFASLGVVGLACKTAPAIAEAMACHGRFQHLTNTTARYESSLKGERILLTEERFGSPCLGSQLVSDYTMLVAVHLVRQVAAGPVPLLGMQSRRADLPHEERRMYEAFLGAPVDGGAPRASLEFHASLFECPVTSSDPELAHYFAALLARAARLPEGEDPLIAAGRQAIQHALAREGAPSVGSVGKRLKLSQRTFQRRLAALGWTFAGLLDATRRSLAEGYLADPELSLAQIGYLLGYREQASFFRAFRRWHGVSPSAYRQREERPDR